MAVHPRTAVGLAVSLLIVAGCSSTPTAGPAATTIARGSETPGNPRPSTVVTTNGGASETPGDLRPSTVVTTIADPSETPGDLQVSTVVTGLDVPWGLAFLPDGSALVTGRDDASVSVIDSASVIDPTGTEASVTPLGTVDGVEHGGEGGLLGIAVSPTFDRDGLLYIYYTAAADNRIATVTLRDGALGDQQVLLDGIPKAGIHNGGRLVFGPDGLLYAGTGDAGDRPNAQDPASLGGKILRLSPDGSPAPGNPLPDSPYVYSSGHRNVQGLAFDDDDRLWAAEFGQNTWDELNLITAGGNYGWPEVEGKGARDGYLEPEQAWPTDEASPSGVAVWQDSVWMAGLRGARLWEIQITGLAAPTRTGEPVAHLTDVYGRLRTVAAAPDGSLWLTTSNTDGRGDVHAGDDRILRIEVAG